MKVTLKESHVAAAAYEGAVKKRVVATGEGV
jgi:hypothetical protein